MNKIKKIFIAAVLAVSFAITGCSTVPVHNSPIIEQQSLLQKCSTDTPLPTNFVLNDKGEQVYDGKELYSVLRDWQTFYNNCAGLHNKLVDTINGVSDMKEIPKK